MTPLAIVVRSFLPACLTIALSLPFSTRAEEVLYEQKLEPYPMPIVLPITLRGGNYSFLLDTGFAVGAFDPAISGLLGAPLGDANLRATDGNMAVKLYEAPPVMLGKWAIPSSRAVVRDHKISRSTFGINCRGIIGAGALRGCALYLDFEHRKLKVTKGGTSPPAEMSELKLDDNPNNVPVVTLPIGKTTAQFIIDTGFNACVGLNREIYQAMESEGLIQTDEAPAGLSASAAGKNRARSGLFTKGKLLDMPLAGVPVVENDQICNIGMAFLLRFNLVMDFGRSRLFVQDRKAQPPLWPHEMLGGILSFQDGHSYIVSVSPYESALRDAGLRIGDRIVSLGDLREADLNYRALYEFCLHHPSESVKVTVLPKNGSDTVVKLLKLPEYQFIYPPDPTRGK